MIDILLYGDFSLDVNVSPSEDTVWLNLEQLSLLFERDKSVISRHISNIIKELELSNDSTIAFFAMVQLEGDRRVERSIPHYNLDMILNNYSLDYLYSIAFANIVKPFILSLTYEIIR